MTVQLVCLAVYALFAVYLYFSNKNEKPVSGFKSILPLALAALLVRIALSAASQGYSTDMNCFRAWSEGVISAAPWNFYGSMWCDYPPGYMYVLAVLGVANRLFGDIQPWVCNIIIKLPACLCDVLGALLVYKIMQQHWGNRNTTTTLAALYLFCPATIINSAVWGQVDAVFTLVLLLSLYMLCSEKYYKSAALLGIAAALKIQALMFAPVFLFVFIERVIKDKTLWKTFAASVGIFAGTAVAVALPFIILKPPTFLFELYSKTMGQYPYASLNAFNLFSLLGANQESSGAAFLLMNYKIWGTIFIVVSVAATGALFLKGRGRGKEYFAAALLIILIFTFASDMHERYLFPAILLLAASYACSKDKRTLYLAGAFSLSQYINVGYLYNMSIKGTYHIPPDDIVLRLGSLFTVIAAFFAIYVFVKLYFPQRERKALPKLKTEKGITRTDTFIIIAVTLIYAIAAFINLGDMKAPQTTFAKGEKQEVVLALGEGDFVGSLIYYKGLGNGKIEVIRSDDGETWDRVCLEDTKECFAWNRIELNIVTRFLGVRVMGEDDTQIYEVGLVNKNTGTLLKPKMLANAWFDEQQLVPDKITYKNGTYFDEIYHPRTAYENIHGIYPYEISHPPLGKIIISLGIRIFGMNPFGWRFMGTVFGILMLPLMYLFGKRVFKNTLLATCAMLLMTFDFMHFSQTRLATIDSFSVFFIILMYYLMYIYYDSTPQQLPYKKALLVLAACGLSFALGIATKWICIYAGVGLAVLFVLATVRREKEEKGTWLKTCLCCIGFFIAVPLAIYFISYIPYYNTDSTRNIFKIFWENQTYMLSYHSKLTQTHPFQSPWYSWPVIWKPIWYFGATDNVREGMVSSIVGMGNPLIWWTGTAAMVALAVTGFRSRKQRFFVIGFLSQFAPWIFIGRAVFIYHFFASVPFIIFALVFIFKYLIEGFKWGKGAVIGFLAASLVLMVMFYPVLSGAEVSREYVNTFLHWFGSWTLSY